MILSPLSVSTRVVEVFEQFRFHNPWSDRLAPITKTFNKASFIYSSQDPCDWYIYTLGVAPNQDACDHQNEITTGILGGGPHPIYTHIYHTNQPIMDR